MDESRSAKLRIVKSRISEAAWAARLEAAHGRMRVIAAPARAPPWFEEDLDHWAFDFEAELDQLAP